MRALGPLQSDYLLLHYLTSVSSASHEIQGYYLGVASRKSLAAGTECLLRASL